MHTIDITIGRNQGDIPMTDVAWATFDSYILDILVTAGSWLESSGWEYEVEHWQGVGRWNGVAEDSSHWQLRSEGKLEDFDLDTIRQYLGKFAAEFKQDAIALIIGQSELVEATPELLESGV